MGKQMGNTMKTAFGLMMAATFVGSMAMADEVAPQQLDQNAMKMNPTQAPGSSTTSLPAAAKDAKKIPFGLDLYQRTSVSKTLLENREDKTLAPTTLNYIQGKYILNESQSIRVRQEFTYAFPKQKANGEQVAGEAKMLDTFIGFNDTKLATLPGDINLTGIFRVYLPTGEATRFVYKTNGMFLGWFILGKEFGKLELNAHMLGLYANNTQETYIDASGAVKPNDVAEIYPFGEVVYNFSDKLNLAQTAGFDNYVRTQPAGMGKQHEENLVLETTLTYKPVKALSAGLSILNNANVWDSSKQFSVYRSDETSYRLILTASL